MRLRQVGSLLSIVALLSACGGDDNGGSTPPPTAGVPSPPPSAPASTCSLQARQEWAAAQLKEWYLFPETLPASLSTAGYNSVDDYIDALTATARAQRRDRYFTYLTSIAEENAYYSSGSTAGFGFRFSYDNAAKRVFVTEAYESAPGFQAGIDRGAEIIAVGDTAATMKTVSALMTSGGPSAVSSAFGPSNPGVTRVLRVSDSNGTRDVTVTKADYSLAPVSSRYGAKIINDGGKRVGYVNLRTFISSADPALRNAFASFRAEGITEIIVDFRYNGGGLVSTAQLLGDLMGGNRSPSEVLGYTTYRPEKAANGSTRYFAPQPQSIGVTRVAFIGTTSSASASELVMNAFIPYLQKNAALIGTNTYGKPVGQIAVDRSQCDDRLRVVAFKTDNALHQGDYFDGLATKMPATCQATDDLTRQMGDPMESSTRQALDFLAGRSCTPISTGISAQSFGMSGKRELLMPARPSTAQREAPGSF